MACKHWKTWSACAAFGGVLIGLGFALNAAIPPQPRFVLRGDCNAFYLSADGKVLITRAWHNAADAGEGVAFTKIKSWDACTGRERHEFFRDFAENDRPKYELNEWYFSFDGRCCALLHPGGLALADLNSGREWPLVIARRNPMPASAAAHVLYGLLRQSVDIQALSEKVKLKDALQYLTEKLDGKLTFRVNRAAFAVEQDAAASDPSEEEVSLPPMCPNMIANTALRAMLSQVGAGNAAFLVREDHIEITTAKRVREEKLWPPEFSARSTFLASLEGGPKESKLHVVACPSGQLVATLSAHPEYEIFGFSPDEELLFYIAPGKKPALTLWSTRERQIAHTFETTDLPTGISEYVFSPDSKMLLLNSSPDGNWRFIDLRSGKEHPVPFDWPFGCLAFSPDCRWLVGTSSNELRILEVPDFKERARIKLNVPINHWFNPRNTPFISADSRVVCVSTGKSPDYTAWSLATGERLWPRVAPAPKADERLANPLGVGVQEVQEEFTGGPTTSIHATPDRRFLIDRKNDRIDLLEPTTGTPIVSLALSTGAHSDGELAFTRDGRTMFASWKFDPDPGLMEKWLGTWWPLPQAKGCFVVTDVATGHVLMRVDHRRASIQQAALSDDGRTLVVDYAQDDGTRSICCWDVPGRPSRLVAFGIPLALGCVAMLIRWRLARSGAARSVASDPSSL